MDLNAVAMPHPVSPNLGLYAADLEDALSLWSPNLEDLHYAIDEALVPGRAAPFDHTPSAGNVQTYFVLMIHDGLAELVICAITTDPATGEVIDTADFKVSVVTKDGDVYWSRHDLSSTAMAATVTVKLPDPMLLIGCTVRLTY
jgi:hypothetical protein